MRSTRTRKVANEPLNLSALVEADPPDFDIKIVDKETGYGVFSRKHFEKGEPLFLYRGTKSVGSLDVMDDSYVFEFSHKGTIYCIDASKNDKSLGRMVNDENRTPNCLPKVVEVMGQPYVVFFALRTIHPGDELRYNYGSGNYPWRKKVVIFFIN
ncbi:N-lysine methyltransferase KMT5A-like [Ruditapes philippinarum]|uniref:N-lysine methyltransferase KMT5A-like n=1 Tax=Ruditapes philippinarum TaxID=129788 RepID=UPI00295B7B27|nr:N-lysine methyltransferase KMT5A-like [Ruditapes philippinarum]